MEHNAAYYDRQNADRTTSDRPEAFVHPPVELAQVWCDKRDKPGTISIPLTDGTRAFRCSQHAWLLIAPNGGRS